MRCAPLVLLVLLCAGLGACTAPEATTPALHPMMLQSPSVLAKGETGLMGKVSWHAITTDGAMDAWSGGARRGLGHDVEASLDASYMHAESSLRTPASASATTMRVGARYCAARGPSDTCDATVFSGVGGGAFDHGGLFGADAGVVVGNDAIFASFRIAVSVPIEARVIDDGFWAPFCILFCDPPTEQSNTPAVTGTFDTLVGFRAPIVSYGQHGGLSLTIGLQLTSIIAAHVHAGFGTGSAVEMVF